MVTLAGVVLLFVLGVLLIAIEIYMPGGIVGTVGAVFLLAANWIVFERWGTDGLMFAVLASVLGVIGAAVLGLVYLPRSALARSMTLTDTQTNETGYVSAAAGLDDLVGREGVAESTLRPSGVARIDGKRHTVVATNAYVEKGASVTVARIEGGRIMVRPLDA